MLSLEDTLACCMYFNPTFDDNSVIDTVLGKGLQAPRFVPQDGGNEPDEGADDEAASTSGQDADSGQKWQVKRQDNRDNECGRNDGPNRPQNAADEWRRSLGGCIVTETARTIAIGHEVQF